MTTGSCEYSEGWLQKFNKHHGIKYLQICCEKVSADYDAAERYIDEFPKMVSDIWSGIWAFFFFFACFITNNLQRRTPKLALTIDF